jgi:EAL domain-containing protein (putative c-di-GMP-specific phosphodiesterase class I)
LQQLQLKKQGDDLGMAVNMSGHQFDKPNFVDQVLSIIDETGIKACQLEIELTESSLMRHPEKVASILEQLRRIGCNIAVDDFGTGYSSLSYLKTFPLMVLKIDRSFVRDIPHDSRDISISNSIISLAKNLHMETVAEGIEEMEQFSTLQRLDCTYGQGFLFSRPVPAEQLQEVLADLNRQAWMNEPS